MQLQTENLGKVAITIEEDYWSNIKDYDKLTIVEVEGKYATYISRKPVPAGTSLTNRKYWIPFSNLKEEILLNFNSWVNNYGGMIASQTQTLNAVQATINDITSHLPQGVTFEGDKNFYRIGFVEEIVLKGKTVNEDEAHFVLYKNDEVVFTKDGSEFEYTDTVNSDSTYTLVTAQGEYSYKSTWNVTSASPFYGGAGKEYTNIINENNLIKVSNDISGLYNISVEENNDYIFFVAPKQYIIETIKLNGIDVPMRSTRNVNLGTDYIVYQSYNGYTAGNYPIIINDYKGLNGDDFLSLLNAVGDAATDNEVEDLKNSVQQCITATTMLGKTITESYGVSYERPTENLFIGFQYFDIVLNIPIWWNGVKWVDSVGSDV